MSRYSIADTGDSAQYIGGVDQFDVFYVPNRGWGFVWSNNPADRKLVYPVEIERPYALFKALQEANTYLTRDQAERICLLIKLFGPKETA